MKSERYNVREAEPRWQQVWDQRGIFKTLNEDPRPKYYVLEMFPYPSGRIHMGHVRNYTMGDVVARYMRAKGFNVLHPMGWDAFGMPAENAAMANKVHPKAWTYDNIAAMKAQLKSMGLSLDWSREIATCDPAYYRHQQKLFLDFWQAGLVERKSSKVNWDPVDHTVLANEQVIDGRGWRSGAEVEQRELTQWFFKISNYSEDLLKAIDTLDRWPEKVRLMQKNWIGRSEGLLIRFALAPASAPKGFDEIEVFTTRHDTLFGASFIAIAPDHPLAKSLAERNPKVAAFIGAPGDELIFTRGTTEAITLVAAAWGRAHVGRGDEILAAIVDRLAGEKPLAGVSALVTSGPTYEPIDPVRFIGNRSSGRQGAAIAQAALDRGAAVTVIAASVSAPPSRSAWYIGPNRVSVPCARRLPMREIRSSSERPKVAATSANGCSVTGNPP